MKCPSYWIAAHLTCIFEIRDQSSNILEKGSRGAGISIKRGVTTTILDNNKKEPEIHFNGKNQPLSDSMVSVQVMNLLLSPEEQQNFIISHSFDIPIGGGFGASAAGALGAAFCINDFFELGYNDLTLYQIAHRSEVLTKSGLGDIIALYQGGLEIRIRAGAPGYGETIGIEMDQKWKIATISFSGLPTSSVLSDSDKRFRVNSTGAALIDQLLLNPIFSNFIKIANKFTLGVQLWSEKVKKIILNLPSSIFGSQIMLGDAILLFYQNDDDLYELNLDSDLIRKEEICYKTLQRLS